MLQRPALASWPVMTTRQVGQRGVTTWSQERHVHVRFSVAIGTVLAVSL